MADPEAPRPFLVSESGSAVPEIPQAFGNEGSVVLLPAPPPQGSASSQSVNCFFGEPLPVSEQATAVAFAPTGTLVVQTREPARLLLFSNPRLSSGKVAIDLGGESIADTGHDLFHRDAGAGIACASCHAEGGEDGHVWRFSGIGARRTQAVHVGLEGTQPFHWNGDMHDLTELMGEVFVTRMGGVHESAERQNALEGWLFALRPPPAMRDLSEPSAERGQKLFESGEVGCTACHSGEALTNNESFDVGTADGRRLQVPSLRGVAYRAPFIHDGCAATLRQRFDASCGGGDLHGKTSQLSSEEIDDLVAYLQTL